MTNPNHKKRLRPLALPYRAALTSLAAICALLCTTQTAQAQAQAQIDLETDLPRMTTSQDVDEIDQRLRGTIVPLRSRTDLGRGFRPRFQDGDGAATLVRFDEERTGWVSSHAHLAQADQVEILINGEWINCEMAHGAIMFDLVQLRPERDSTEHDRALPIARSWPLDGTLFTHVANPPESDPELFFLGLGEAPQEPWNYYVRLLGSLRNGFPIVSRDGHVVAIASIAAPDRRGGVLAIPFTMFNTWVNE
ncbi:MAG: hypothetical protein ACJA1R_002330, partial [Flavobacteriales bacterium]